MFREKRGLEMKFELKEGGDISQVKEKRDWYIGGTDYKLIAKGNLSTIRKKKLDSAEFKGNKYTGFGNTMEPKIRDFINERFEKNFQQMQLIDEELGLRANMDGLTEDFQLLEVKTTVNDSPEHMLKLVKDNYFYQVIFYVFCVSKFTGKTIEEVIGKTRLAFYLNDDDCTFRKENLKLMTFNLKREPKALRAIFRQGYHETEVEYPLSVLAIEDNCKEYRKYCEEFAEKHAPIALYRTPSIFQEAYNAYSYALRQFEDAKKEKEKAESALEKKMLEHCYIKVGKFERIPEKETQVRKYNEEIISKIENAYTLVKRKIKAKIKEIK